jgi:MFS family permease
MPSEMSGTGGPKGVLPGAGSALALLLAINLFNYIDRQILSATLPKIRLDASIFHPIDSWATFKLGILTTAFMIAYMVLSPVFGRLGDRMSRWVIVGMAVILWSLATGGTGLAIGYTMLVLTRCLVGVGEAAYGPIAPAMLSDLYPVDHRGRILSWFYAAIPVGSALGFVIGSQVAETDLGWRGAFLVAVIPGLLLGVLCLFRREPPRPNVQADPTSGGSVSVSHAPNYLAVLKELWGIRSFVLLCAGMTASTFVLGGVASVMQLYIFEREARFTIDMPAIERLEALTNSTGERVVAVEVTDKLRRIAGPERFTAAELRENLNKTLSESELENSSTWLFREATAEGSISNGMIGLTLGGIIVVAGLVATLLGGAAGDWFRKRGVKGAYFHVAGWGTLAGFPFFVAILYVPFPLAWVMIFLAVFALFFNTGPANTVLANVSRQEIRATAFAINILVIHALGDAISPPIIGIITALSSMHTAFLATSFLIPVAGVLWVLGARYLDADTQRAESVV